MKYKIKSKAYPDELQVVICDDHYEGSELSYDPNVTISYGVGDCVICDGTTEKEEN